MEQISQLKIGELYLLCYEPTLYRGGKKGIMANIPEFTSTKESKFVSKTQTKTVGYIANNTKIMLLGVTTPRKLYLGVGQNQYSYYCKILHKDIAGFIVMYSDEKLIPLKQR